ncbi:hypothetical protein BJ742DRAFT_793745 [Cladochytrium replicatum]|nr:hypothetical protein BJ742DRAFT_793745 [Cladochytrium replicatum]
MFSNVNHPHRHTKNKLHPHQSLPKLPDISQPAHAGSSRGDLLEKSNSFKTVRNWMDNSQFKPTKRGQASGYSARNLEPYVFGKPRYTGDDATEEYEKTFAEIVSFGEKVKERSDLSKIENVEFGQLTPSDDLAEGSRNRQAKTHDGSRGDSREERTLKGFGRHPGHKWRADFVNAQDVYRSDLLSTLKEREVDRLEACGNSKSVSTVLEWVKVDLEHHFKAPRSIAMPEEVPYIWRYPKVLTDPQGNTKLNCV